MILKNLIYEDSEKKFIKSIIYFNLSFYRLISYNQNQTADETLVKIHKAKKILMEAITLIFNFIEIQNMKFEKSKDVLFRRNLESNLGISLGGLEQKTTASPTIRVPELLNYIEEIKYIFDLLISQVVSNVFSKKREDKKKEMYNILSVNANILAKKLISKNQKTIQKNISGADNFLSSYFKEEKVTGDGEEDD